MSLAYNFLNSMDAIAGFSDMDPAPWPNSHRRSVKVAEQALCLWNNEHIVGLIAENRRVIWLFIFEPLEKNVQSHWNQAVHGLTGNVQRMFLEMDTELFEEYR